MNRVISYIDGFNLYFGLKSKGWRKYYWLDVAGLSRSLLKEDQTLQMCHYFTAKIRTNGRSQSAHRQNIWLDALEARDDISIQYGHYLQKQQKCRNCGSAWNIYEEKMTDVNIASQLLVDAFKDNFDTAIIISGDSDLTTPIKQVRAFFPNKKVIVVFPPNRSSHQLRQASNGYLSIGQQKLRTNLLPDQIVKADGYTLQRPSEWH